MLAFDDYMNHEGSEITMAADPFGEVAEQLGLLEDMDTLGNRCKRFAAIIDNNKILDNKIVSLNFSNFWENTRTKIADRLI